MSEDDCEGDDVVIGPRDPQLMDGTVLSKGRVFSGPQL